MFPFECTIKIVRCHHALGLVTYFPARVVVATGYLRWVLGAWPWTNGHGVSCNSLQWSLPWTPEGKAIRTLQIDSGA